jgi:glutamate dehydrogenase
MDTIEIKEIGEHGTVVGEHRITGLFTAKALQQLCSEIPVLRRKLNAVLEQAEVLEGSHEYKHITRLFNSIPKSELFATSVEQLGRVIDELVELQRGNEVRLSCHPDIAEQGISVMVILPRERFNTEIRQQVQDALSDRFGVPPTDYRLVISNEPFARFHFYFPTFHRLTVQEIAELESLVRGLGHAGRS